MSRAEQLRVMSPQLVADVTMYATDQGGRKYVAQPGWGCPCVISKSQPVDRVGRMAAFGERRRLGFVFLSGEEAAKIFRRAGFFYLWECGFIGEAAVVP